MTTYTDTEIDAVALAMVNAQRKFFLVPPFADLARCESAIQGGAALVRECARAALAARDALFEVAEERWDINGPRGFWTRHSHAEAHELAREKRAAGVEVTVVHVTTRRRKR